MIQLTALSEQLLPTQVRISNTFKLKLVRENPNGSTAPINATLKTQHEGDTVLLELRAGDDKHTLRTPWAKPEQLAATAKTWIEDCANGVAERAA